MQTGYHGLNRSSLILLELIDKLTLMNSSEHLMYHMLVLKLCATIYDIINFILYHQSTFFAERFFHLFDIDNSGTISLRELMDGLTILTQGTRVEKLRFLFRVYDVDGK